MATAFVAANSGAVQRILEALGLQHRRVSRLEIVIDVREVATVTATVTGPLHEEEADALADSLPELSPEIRVEGSDPQIDPDGPLFTACSLLGMPHRVQHQILRVLTYDWRYSHGRSVPLPSFTVRSLADLPRQCSGIGKTSRPWVNRLLTAAGLESSQA